MITFLTLVFFQLSKYITLFFIAYLFITINIITLNYCSILIN